MNNKLEEAIEILAKCMRSHDARCESCYGLGFKFVNRREGTKAVCDRCNGYGLNSTGLVAFSNADLEPPAVELVNGQAVWSAAKFNTPTTD